MQRQTLSAPGLDVNDILKFLYGNLSLLESRRLMLDTADRAGISEPEQELRRLISEFRTNTCVQRAARRNLVLTVTPGRSGTRLLARLLGKAAGLNTEHEPEPMANLEMRPNLIDPIRGLRWLVEQKLPQMLVKEDQTYIETSHIYGKGFIEHFLMLGIKPRFIILRRPHSEVAQSLYRISAIPGRTFAGRTVLLQPEDAGVMPLTRVDLRTDYQLCYWYALEMERRQMFYAGVFRALGIEYVDISMTDLLAWERFNDILNFIDPSVGNANYAVFKSVSSENQNPSVRHVSLERPLPIDIAAQEQAIDWACAPYLAPGLSVL